VTLGHVEFVHDLGGQKRRRTWQLQLSMQFRCTSLVLILHVIATTLDHLSDLASFLVCTVLHS